MTAHFSMIRGFHLADWITLGNAGCGTGAIFVVMRSLQDAKSTSLLAAAALIAIAFVLDVLDGRVARQRHEQSPLGRELDSLSDVISFGVAPASLAYGVGMQGGWDVAVLLAFVACGVSRLARYNVTADKLAAGGDKPKYFEGTPIPSSLFLVGVLAVAIWRDRVGDALWGGSVRLGPSTLHPLVLAFALSGSLMISKTLRIPKL
ncbi:MAG TPA: CDP-diacylglycerol--serine O-phosphatidyltransferase [Planctomycetota bacterium]|jgi:CDP-diacylglycerol--serine O-phosphatidyltransferase|nr:CDP-diacylglycerol--serine O-phosphatidyltransferase [Planctomycetota bacterium]